MRRLQVNIMKSQKTDLLKTFDKQMKEASKTAQSGFKRRTMMKVLFEHDVQAQILDEDETAAIQQIIGFYKSLEPMRNMIERKVKTLGLQQ